MARLFFVIVGFFSLTCSAQTSPLVAGGWNIDGVQLRRYCQHYVSDAPNGRIAGQFLSEKLSAQDYVEAGMCSGIIMSASQFIGRSLGLCGRHRSYNREAMVFIFLDKQSREAIRKNAFALVREAMMDDYDCPQIMKNLIRSETKFLDRED